MSLIPYVIKPFDNQYANYNLNALIMSLIVISVPILIALIIPLFKSKLGEKSSLFLYSFTAGFFIIIGLFGEIPEGNEVISNAYNETSGFSDAQLIGIKIGVIAGTAFLGFGFALGFKIIMTQKIKKSTDTSIIMHNHDYHDGKDEEFHNHIHGEELLLSRSQKTLNTKIIAIFLILSHRIVAGYFLGYSVYQLVNGNTDAVTVTFLVGFFLHLIPEEAIIYYRLREMHISRFKSAWISIAMVCILIPLIFLGANTGSSIDQIPWLQAMLHVMVGVMFTFTALVEFMPEIISKAKQEKMWYYAIAFMIAGILIAFIILNLHGHDHNHTNPNIPGGEHNHTHSHLTVIQKTANKHIARLQFPWYQLQ